MKEIAQSEPPWIKLLRKYKNNRTKKQIIKILLIGTHQKWSYKTRSNIEYQERQRLIIIMSIH